LLQVSEQSDFHSDRAPTMVQTLLAGGFQLETARSQRGYSLFNCYRVDELGVEVRYLFALCDGSLEDAALAAIVRMATRNRAYLVLVGEKRDSIPSLSWSAFMSRFGGEVKYWLPLEPRFASDLNDLGHNRSVPGLDGSPNDLFEEYVHVALQFVLSDRVIRYGQARRGEAVPDGLALPRRVPLFLYDAKAAGDGYEVTYDSMRQFSDYVNTFHETYTGYVPRLHCFLVISGHFQNRAESLDERSVEMYQRCQVPLVYLTTTDLGGITSYLVERPSLRPALNWKQLLSRRQLTLAAVEVAGKMAIRDGVVRA
jgi:hypothetical protein